MKAVIKTNIEEAIISRAFGKTWAEKKCNARQDFIDLMKPFAGQTVEIEPDHLFEDQFNVVEPNARLHWTFIEKLILEPEFKNAQELIEVVQKQYDKKWPGTKVNPYYINELCKGQ